MEFNGTKGEWKGRYTTIGDHYVIELNDVPVLKIKKDKYSFSEITRNMQLMVASQDLLECLQAYVDDDESGSLKNQNAIDAINKSLGI